MAVLVIHQTLLLLKEIMAVHQLVALAEQGEGQAQRVKEVNPQAQELLAALEPHLPFQELL
jgi:hypothetical protein